MVAKSPKNGPVIIKVGERFYDVCNDVASVVWVKNIIPAIFNSGIGYFIFEWVTQISLSALFSVIPECFYPRYKHSGTDMVFA